MRIMRSRQPALPASPHPLMRVAAATSASPRRPGCTRLYFPQGDPVPVAPITPLPPACPSQRPIPPCTPRPIRRFPPPPLALNLATNSHQQLAWARLQSRSGGGSPLIRPPNRSNSPRGACRGWVGPLLSPERPRGHPVLGPENAATVRGAAVSPDAPEIGWVPRHLPSTIRRALAGPSGKTSP